MIIDNPIAFPHEYRNNDNTIGVDPGMTLRDYFAAKAMVAYAMPHRKSLKFKYFLMRIFNVNGAIGRNNHPDTADIARMAYNTADAMLAERLK